MSSAVRRERSQIISNPTGGGCNFKIKLRQPDLNFEYDIDNNGWDEILSQLFPFFLIITITPPLFELKDVDK